MESIVSELLSSMILCRERDFAFDDCFDRHVNADKRTDYFNLRVVCLLSKLQL